MWKWPQEGWRRWLLRDQVKEMGGDYGKREDRKLGQRSTLSVVTHLMSAGRGQEEEEGPALDDHPTGFVELQEWRKRNQTRLAKPSTLQAASQQGRQTLGRRHLGKIGGKRVNPAFQL